ncbi:hypothetical protein T484DRAFT_1820553, partial [Baffinella frigidus]
VKASSCSCSAALIAVLRKRSPLGHQRGGGDRGGGGGAEASEALGAESEEVSHERPSVDGDGEESLQQVAGRVPSLEEQAKDEGSGGSPHGAAGHRGLQRGRGEGSSKDAQPDHRATPLHGAALPHEGADAARVDAPPGGQRAPTTVVVGAIATRTEHGRVDAPPGDRALPPVSSPPAPHAPHADLARRLEECRDVPAVRSLVLDLRFFDDIQVTAALRTLVRVVGNGSSGNGSKGNGSSGQNARPLSVEEGGLAEALLERGGVVARDFHPQNLAELFTCVPPSTREC